MSDERDEKRRRRWFLLILLVLLFLALGICSLARSRGEITVSLVVFGDPLAGQTVTVEVFDSADTDVAPVDTHDFMKAGDIAFGGLDTSGQYWIEASTPGGCESVVYASGVSQDLKAGEAWDELGDEFEGGTTGTVVVVCGGYYAELVLSIDSPEGDPPTSEVVLWFEVTEDPENPALQDIEHEGSLSSRAPQTLTAEPGQFEVWIVGDPSSGETVDEVLSGMPGGPCRMISPLHFDLGEIALQQTSRINVEVACDGADTSSTSATSTTEAKSADVTGTWLFRIEVTGVKGSVCQGEIGDSYEREVTISGADEALVVIGLDDLDDPDDPSWIGKYASGSLVLGGTRAEDDGTTTATFELTLADDGTLLAGEESWTWDWTSRGETGTCTEGTSTVTATRLP